MPCCMTLLYLVSGYILEEPADFIFRKVLSVLDMEVLCSSMNWMTTYQTLQPTICETLNIHVCFNI
jgi:hypothetical protein